MRLVDDYLADVHELVVDEIRSRAPTDGRHTAGLYGMALDYPLRGAKGLRPALCLAVGRHWGASTEALLPTATALELYHNAFLVHDDIEDGSELRRGRPTLSADHGIPIAINVGDALLALAMRPLLDNTEVIGVRRSLRVLHEVASMASTTAEGQALELAWVRGGRWAVRERDYVRMVYLKTARYSFVSPARCGAIVADRDHDDGPLVRMAALLGIAFQIRDDVLNLVHGPSYGKEQDGDLWEGKHTLALVHTLALATPIEQQRAEVLLACSRRDKLPSEVSWLRALVDRYGGIEFAREVGLRYARRAGAVLPRTGLGGDNVHARFLAGLVEYVVQRSW